MQNRWKDWTTKNIPNLTGKNAIVTGANSGVGFVTALELAKHGCQVILACRNEEKGEVAKQEILTHVPKAKIVVAHLDCADFSSIKRFARDINSSYDSLSLLVNNAGVLGIPYIPTKDGYETVFQTNYLSQFLLTKELMPLLEKDGAARVVHVASNTHHNGYIDFENLQQDEAHYRRADAYPNSKLAGLIFALELDRRLRAAHSSVISVAAHPGYSATNILTHDNTGNVLQRGIFRLGNAVYAQTKEQGALPILLACTDPDVNGGDFFGPDGPSEMSGNPSNARVSETASNKALAIKLWDVSEKLTGCQFLHRDLPKALKIIVNGKNASWLFYDDNHRDYFFRVKPITIEASAATVWQLVKDLNHYHYFSDGELRLQINGDVKAGNTFHSALYANHLAGCFIPSSTEEITLVDDAKRIIHWRRALPFAGGYAERLQWVDALSDQTACLYSTLRVPGKFGFFTQRATGDIISYAFSKLFHGIKEKAEQGHRAKLTNLSQ